MNHFKEHLLSLGVLEDFIYVALREPDYIEHKWTNRIDYTDEISVHNIFYYSKASEISKINWESVFSSFKWSRVYQSELLEIMSGVTTKKPSIFKNKKD